MSSKIHRHQGQALDITYDVKRCIHAAECVNRLRAVFDPDKRPWIQPDQAPADRVAEVIRHCPSGALHYERHDGAAEPTPETNTIRLEANGPLYLRGALTLVNAASETVMTETRLALCRCGAAKNKPFCDHAHKESGFQASDSLTNPVEAAASADASGPLTIAPQTNGSVKVSGNHVIVNSQGEVIHAAAQCWLCRCGSSANKPFCDGTHKKIGFQAE